MYGTSTLPLSSSPFGIPTGIFILPPSLLQSAVSLLCSIVRSSDSVQFSLRIPALRAVFIFSFLLCRSQAPSPTLTHPQMLRSASVIEVPGHRLRRGGECNLWSLHLLQSPGSPTPLLCPPPNRRFAAYLPLYDPAVRSVRRPTSCLVRSRSMSRKFRQSVHAACRQLGSWLRSSPFTPPSTPRLASPSTSTNPAPCDLVRSLRRRPTVWISD
ncbi:hypothetical protein FA13DRAFT_1179078 [Coprinellus micaceus]|uniref:Uncharacterized protein n=1 Tax=Coprinellus micaceus TaxID=71717 RepID=A0A4Y7STX9_COPMI|nr:hypothetical protein FA13DRAFT_1179078 [Coprinellus micaceus]